ncbi:8-oxo-dGTP diphosphatase [Buchnera aphidicola (Protaphis terricola)]|uniref:NUDIX domain-containing protein n=1 Tax=Buchnera aphidicola TaxID=9 RepID=UPI003464DE70
MNYIKVAIGIVLNKNKIYITKANKNKYNLNTWEFPGGKIKKNEKLISGLKRELFEEVGIKILYFSFFQYKKIFFKKIKLYFFLVKKWKGKIYSREGYKHCWVDVKTIKNYQFPISNYTVIKKLKNIFLR